MQHMQANTKNYPANHIRYHRAAADVSIYLHVPSRFLTEDTQRDHNAEFNPVVSKDKTDAPVCTSRLPSVTECLFKHYQELQTREKVQEISSKHPTYMQNRTV